MITGNKLQRTLSIGIPFLIFSACILLTFTTAYSSNQQLLSNAILADLLITAPLVYFFLIRKSNVSKLTVIRVFVIGLLIAGLILNAGTNSLLHFIKTWISPLIEAFVIFIVVRKFHQANKAAKLSGKNADFLTHCRMVMYEVTGNHKAANIISSEIAVFYYSFAGKKAKDINYESRFSAYKDNGVILVTGTFLGLFLIETIGMHFILTLWNHTAAWIITTLGFYTCLQLFAHIRALKARPVIINDHSLEIHSGLAGDAVIAFDNIEKLELTNKVPAGRNAIKMSLFNVLENHNCVVYLKKPIEVTKFFGIKKRTDTVLFFVDRPKDFAEALARWSGHYSGQAIC